MRLRRNLKPALHSFRVSAQLPKVKPSSLDGEDRWSPDQGVQIILLMPFINQSLDRGLITNSMQSTLRWDHQKWCRGSPIYTLNFRRTLYSGLPVCYQQGASTSCWVTIYCMNSAPSCCLCGCPHSRIAVLHAGLDHM